MQSTYGLLPIHRPSGAFRIFYWVHRGLSGGKKNAPVAEIKEVDLPETSLPVRAIYLAP
jgi:hypothetical protein